jgi:isoquinoline 1-oxidoreductase beta subunit
MDLSRRDFLKLAGVSGAGLVLAIYLDGCAPAPTPIKAAPTSPPATVPPTTLPTIAPTPTAVPVPGWDANIYLRIDVEGIITVTAFRSELGQGIRTAIAMILAEELDADWADIRIRQAPADAAYGDQQTGGSVSISAYCGTLQRAGATARQMLVNAAAGQWDVAPEECTTAASSVLHPDGINRLAYKDLADAAAKLEMPQQVTTKSRTDYRLIGTDNGHWDAPAILTGKAVFGMDVRLPGMLYATMARCPVLGGTIASYDDREALATPGVRQVLNIEDSLAVVADHTWAAIRGRSALKITWDEGQNSKNSTATIREELVKTAESLASSGRDFTEMYEIPFEAHATMEPMNCTAYFHNDMCEIWAPTQSPQAVQREASRALDLPGKSVIVNVPLIGGGFGRRLQADYAVEAALVSKATGLPVQVVWTRDDDLQHDFYHPASAGVVSSNTPLVGAPRVMTIDASIFNYVNTGPWRSVGEFPSAFAAQSALGEIAAELDLDPLELLKQLYKGNALGVIELAAEKSGWGSPLPAGWGRGIAYHATFGATDVAQVAEVSVDAENRVTVHRVVCAVDCGLAVNPKNVIAQMEGGIAFGLTAALKAQVTIENGRVQQSNFDDYPILRIDEMPAIEVYIVESDASPSGIGEMGVPPIAPAVANAIFAATGKRIRKLPILPEDLANA